MTKYITTVSYSDNETEGAKISVGYNNDNDFIDFIEYIAESKGEENRIKMISEQACKLGIEILNYELLKCCPHCGEVLEAKNIIKEGMK